VEIEVKVRIEDLAEMARRAEALGLRLRKARHFEGNTLYDYPDRALSTCGCLLRVRQEDGEGLLTFKGKLVTHEKYKVRPEIESACADAKAVEEILRNIGLRPFFRYEKYRTEYEGDGVLLCLDELPFGRFLEIEGGEGTIDPLAERLGLNPSTFMKRTYADLYGEYCRENGIHFGDIVFPEKPSRKP
jgi:adenylate cyclase, class 2